MSIGSVVLVELAIDCPKVASLTTIQLIMATLIEIKIFISKVCCLFTSFF